MTASTAAAMPNADLPLGDQLVLRERPLRAGAVLAQTARFDDDIWPLSPAQLKHHQDHMRLNFRSRARTLPSDRQTPVLRDAFR
jgi:hypothetical protein